MNKGHNVSKNVLFCFHIVLGVCVMVGGCSKPLLPWFRTIVRSITRISMVANVTLLFKQHHYICSLIVLSLFTVVVCM